MIAYAYWPYCTVQGYWAQLAMVQSMENGELAFLHRTARGAKTGRDGEDNPIRRWWPNFLTTPVTRHIGPRIIGWDGGKDIVSVDKGAFDQDSFKCISHPSGSNLKPSARPRSISRTRAFLSSWTKRHPSQPDSISEALWFKKQRDGNSAESHAPSPSQDRHETICAWDGSLSISKIDFLAESGMYTAVMVVKAFEHAFDSVLKNFSAPGEPQHEPLEQASLR